MDKRGKEGTTLRQDLISVQRQTGRAPKQLIGPELPKHLEYLWGWFNDLDHARGGSGFGPSPISYSELLAWTTLSGIRPQSWEIRAIRLLDTLYLAAQADDQPHDLE